MSRVRFPAQIDFKSQFKVLLGLIDVDEPPVFSFPEEPAQRVRARTIGFSGTPLPTT